MASTALAGAVLVRILSYLRNALEWTRITAPFRPLGEHFYRAPDAAGSRQAGVGGDEGDV